MQANLMFHNVGQGLFYSGQIKCGKEPNFNFVYDCGGVETTPRSRSLTLDTCIKRHTHFLKKESIDMLVISHFHSDHINGIAKLLEKNKVKDIIIPFYTFEERLSVLLSEFHSKMTNDQISFLLNPYLFLSKKNVERIIVITHQENNDGMNIDNSITLEDLDRDIPSGSEYDELRDNSKIIVMTDKQPIKKACWNFAFYADDSQKGTFNQTQALQAIEELKNATTKENRVLAIKQIKSSYGITTSSYYNETSLIMVHKVTEGLMQLYPYQYSVHHPIRYCHEFFMGISKHIHILTGDFSFKKKAWNDVKKHFGSFIDAEASVIQIAHHGSIDNWDNGILRHTPDNNLCIIPYGTKNRYGHPAIDVMSDILDNPDCLYEVTENQSLMMFYR